MSRNTLSHPGQRRLSGQAGGLERPQRQACLLRTRCPPALPPSIWGRAGLLLLDPRLGWSLGCPLPSPPLGAGAGESLPGSGGGGLPKGAAQLLEEGRARRGMGQLLGPSGAQGCSALLPFPFTPKWVTFPEGGGGGKNQQESLFPAAVLGRGRKEWEAKAVGPDDRPGLDPAEWEAAVGLECPRNMAPAGLTQHCGGGGSAWFSLGLPRVTRGACAQSAPTIADQLLTHPREDWIHPIFHKTQWLPRMVTSPRAAVGLGYGADGWIWGRGAQRACLSYILPQMASFSMAGGGDIWQGIQWVHKACHFVNVSLGG